MQIKNVDDDDVFTEFLRHLLPPWVCKVATFFCLWTVALLAYKVCHL